MKGAVYYRRFFAPFECSPSLQVISMLYLFSILSPNIANLLPGQQITLPFRHFINGQAQRCFCKKRTLFNTWPSFPRKKRTLFHGRCQVISMVQFFFHFHPQTVLDFCMDNRSNGCCILISVSDMKFAVFIKQACDIRKYCSSFATARGHNRMRRIFSNFPSN